MIEKVRITKDEHKAVTVFYHSGLIASYAYKDIPETATNFILENDTIAHENDWCQWYTK